MEGLARIRNGHRFNENIAPSRMSVHSESLGESQGGEETLSRENRLFDLMEKKKKLQLLMKGETGDSGLLKELDVMIIQAQAEYGALYNETAPVSNVPIEILCQIFKAAHNASRIYGVPKHPFVELIISHVCRGWRSVALSFPPLWSTFRYDAAQSADRKPKERLDAYLERSSSHLLDLYFEFAQSTFDEGSRTLFNTMLESTLPHVARWRRFSLSSGKDFPILGFSDRLRELEAPNLEYFFIRPNVLPETLALDGLSPRVFLGGAPKLSYLRMDASCPSKYLPPLSNITVLRIERFTRPVRQNFGSWSSFLEILALPSLSSLSIVGQHFSKPQHHHPSTITMKNLKHLRYGDENNLFGHFFSCLSAPLLETLTLCGLDPPPTPLNLKNKQPFSMLYSLTVIDCPDFDLTIFSDLATVTPYVTHLTVRDESGFESVLQCINEQFAKNKKKLWPKLNVLTGIFYDENDISLYLDFARMIANPELIIRTSASIVGHWAGGPKIKQLEAMCVLEEIPRGSQVIPWPPGADVPAQSDFFTIYHY